MLKDLKEKVKYISEIVGMISVTGTLIAIITSTLYDFGYFYSFSVHVWNLPISFSEILKDSVVIFPKLLMIYILSVIPAGTYILLVLFIKPKPKVNYDGIRYLIYIFTFFIVLICFKPSFGIHPGFLFVVLMFFAFIYFYGYFYENTEEKTDTILNIIFVLATIQVACIFVIVSSGFYEARFELKEENAYRDCIMFKDETTVNNVKILRVYDKGIVVIKEKNSIDFLYSENIKNYSIHSKSKIFADTIQFIYGINLSKYKKTFIYALNKNKMMFNKIIDFVFSKYDFYLKNCEAILH